jgi:hypothetical protein
MADRDGAIPTRVVVRKLVFTAIGVFLFAVGLTVLFQGMRTVMDVGGYCASGGPYEIRQQCPDNAWMIPVGIFVGLGGVGFVLAGTFRGGPKLVALAWPALFLALGWNFLEYAFDPPPPDNGIVWGWLICGVVFVAMGGIPLLFVLANAKLALWGKDATGDKTAVAAATATALARLVGTRSRTPTTFVHYGDTTVPATTTTTAGPEPPVPPEPPFEAPSDGAGGNGDLVSDLERLAALHSRGQLTDDEYARAKDARLSEEHP